MHDMAGRDQKGRILIVEDEAAIREMLGYSLMKEGYVCAEAADIEQAREQVRNSRPDIILLDWMLPGMSGIDYARRLRSDPVTQDIPVIMLTAKSDEADKIRALDTGADDYITKPFSTRELLARIRAVLRRYASDALKGDLKIIKVDGLVLDTESYRVTARGENIEFSPTEFKLLYFFCTHPERVYTRTQLLDHV
ncbi:MAG: response regulator, partial [Gammaproteobacteria bacterium]